jgi:hypothetical protein
VVKLLLATGKVDVDAKYGQTPLWWAAQNAKDTVRLWDAATGAPHSEPPAIQIGSGRSPSRRTQTLHRTRAGKRKVLNLKREIPLEYLTMLNQVCSLYLYLMRNVRRCRIEIPSNDNDDDDNTQVISIRFKSISRDVCQP